MVVGAAGDQVVAALGQRRGQRPGGGHHRCGVVPERRLRRLLQRHRDARRGVVVRPTLQAGEHRLVQRGRVLRGGHQHRTAGPPQRLVGGGGDDVGEPHRRGVRATGDQPGDVRHVGDEDGAHLAGDLGEGAEVDDARYRRTAAEDQLRPLAAGQVAHLVIVEATVVAPHGVLHRAEPLAGRRHRPAVRQVAAHRQRHAHHGVARLGEGQVHGQVGGRAGVRLHVGVIHAEQGLGALHRERLDRVDELLPLVVPTAGVALGVLVGEHRAGGLQHGGGHVVLRGDQPDLLELALRLAVDELGDLGVGLGKMGRCGRVDRGPPGRQPLRRDLAFTQARGARSRVASRWLTPPDSAPVATRACYRYPGYPT